MYVTVWVLFDPILTEVWHLKPKKPKAVCTYNTDLNTVKFLIDAGEYVIFFPSESRPLQTIEKSTKKTKNTEIAHVR